MTTRISPNTVNPYFSITDTAVLHQFSFQIGLEKENALAHGKQDRESTYGQLKTHVVGFYMPFWWIVVEDQWVKLCGKLLDHEILLHELL
jgi:hypothetical protein